MFVHESKQSRIECGCCVAEMATAVAFLPIKVCKNAIFSPKRTGFVTVHGFTRTADIHRAVGPQKLALALRCHAENM